MDSTAFLCAIILILSCIIKLTNQVSVGDFHHVDPLGSLHYSAAMLRSLRPDVNSFQPAMPLPPEVKRRKRGRKGGVKARLRRRSNRPPLPVIVTGNTRSLNNKMDEFSACVRFLHEYREASAIACTETWFSDTTPNGSVDLENFSLVRGDRTPESGKRRGGGVCLYVSDKWCHPNNIHRAGHMCTPDVEMLSVGIRPYYLPREFPKVTINVVYIPPQGNDDTAAETITETINDQLTKSPDGVVLLMGDFNTCNVDHLLPTFEQYVKVPTRGEKTLDRCYGNIKGAYKSRPLPPLGNSDHIMVHLTPVYQPKIKTIKPERKCVEVWDESASEKLRGCFECTDWSVFFESNDDINVLTDTLSSYIQFCESLCITTKQVTCYPNNKPWVTAELKALITAKKRAFQSNDECEKRKSITAVKNKIKECKENYRNKLHEQFSMLKTKEMWQGLKKIVGYKEKESPLSVDHGQSYADKLNTFYARFDTNASEDIRAFKSSHLKSFEAEEPTVSEREVVNIFSSLKVNKAQGPDGVKPKTLKLCSSQLAVPYTILFNLSLRTHSIPHVWKTSVIVPVPKKQKVTEMNDLRPVALTSVLMKCLEKFVLSILLPAVKSYQDPNQYAYKYKRGVDDAIAVFVDNIYRNIEVPKTYSRVLFIDFSSAFNTIQPTVLTTTLLSLGINKHITAWIFEFLTERPQYVKLKVNDTIFLSESIVTNTGAPQGTCISPALFTIYTDECRSTSECIKILKFADDTTIQGHISCQSDLSTYKNAIENFVSWCNEHSLHLNVKKTKELIIDFRTSGGSHENMNIDGQQVEIVDSYKYLGVNIDNKLNWHVHASSVLSKINRRLYFIRKLKCFNIDCTLITLFYTSIIESLISFCIAVWGGNARLIDKNRINQCIKRVSKITSIGQEEFNSIYDKQCNRKIKSILKDPSHPMFQQIQFSTRSGRVLLMKTTHERYRRSFLPSAVRQLSTEGRR